MFLVLGLVILAAPAIAERVRLPGVVGLVVAGVALGPGGLGVLERTGVVEQLGGVGLLYLMFLAGLELDLGQLAEQRRPTVLFGLTTFVFPLVLGAAVSLAFGYEWLPAVLIGSLWASHTLVAYPVVRRAGLIADPAVMSAVGATVITDTLALATLAVVAGAAAGSGLGFLALLVPGSIALAWLLLWVLPRVARAFFAGLGADRTVRFVFVLTAVMGSAVVAEAVGTEGIIGAFLAGLGLNRLVPTGGVLMQRIEFVGSALLVPIFLISVGMLVDVGLVLDPATLALGAGFSGVAMIGKGVAAIVAGRISGFDRPQITAMFALSNAQAAATLAATIVGLEVGLLDARTVNAVLIVILVTVVVSSASASRAVRELRPAPVARRPLGRTVIIPIANPTGAREIGRVGSWIAHADGGSVVPLHVVTDLGQDHVASGRRLVDGVADDLARLGVETEVVLRIDRSARRGIVNTLLERDATLVLVGWKGEETAKDRVLGSLLADITEAVPCVIAACRLVGTPRRLVVDLDRTGSLSADEAAALDVSRRLAAGSGLPTVSSRPDLGWTTDVGAFRDGDVVVVPSAPGREPVAPGVRSLIDGHPNVGVIIVRAGDASPTVVEEMFGTT